MVLKSLVAIAILAPHSNVVFSFLPSHTHNSLQNSKKRNSSEETLISVNNEVALALCDHIYPTHNFLDSYAAYWDNLLCREHQENVNILKHRLKSWSKTRLERSGMSIFSASAGPETEIYGEKIVRVWKYGESNFKEKFNRGDSLVITPEIGFRGKDPYPREGLVMDVGTDWITLGVGSSWPVGLFEMRKHPGRYLVRIDRSSPLTPLKAQRIALEKLKKGQAGPAAYLFAYVFDEKHDSVQSAEELSRKIPRNFPEFERITIALGKAISRSKSFHPNQYQREAIVWALSRTISLIKGPPGTGKTRVAALLISTALILDQRVLAVTHSNGAADVLLQALLEMNVPAVRAGRAASVSAAVQHRTIAALAGKMPEVAWLRHQTNDSNQDPQTRQSAAFDMKKALHDAKIEITRNAPVIVTSCIGAQQLLSNLSIDDDNNGVTFPIVVLDEAGQTTEPALLCALASSEAKQVILIGDTKQLPPTVKTECRELRQAIGFSPMERLLQNGVLEYSLREQYRMPPALLFHPNNYFYGGVIKCAPITANSAVQTPRGFPWPNPDIPLAFVDIGTDHEVTHDFGGKSNPAEAQLITDMVNRIIQAGDVDVEGMAIISPYSKQVQRMRKVLKNFTADEIKIGTIDSFQGQETDIVIVSTVRSNIIKEVGFLGDDRRLNVAITRAKRALIVVGDSIVLRTCRHWSAFIESCSDRGCLMTESEYSDYFERKGNSHHHIFRN